VPSLIELLEDKNIYWDKVPMWIKFGFYCKKDLYGKEIDGQLITRVKTKL